MSICGSLHADIQSAAEGVAIEWGTTRGKPSAEFRNHRRRSRGSRGESAETCVADLTLTIHHSKFRPTPNPNVLVELGYPERRRSPHVEPFYPGPICGKLTATGPVRRRRRPRIVFGLADQAPVEDHDPMVKRYPNVEHLLAALPDGSLARTLCECFVKVGSSEEAKRNLRSVLDKRLAELREPTADEDEQP